MTERFALPASLKELRNYVDGEFVATSKTFDNVSPLHGKLLAKVHEADAALVDRAVRAARRALDEGPWGRATVEERAKWLHRVADVIERRFDDFLAAEIADTGRPLEQARKLDVYRGIANFRTFADLGKTAHGDFFETHLADGTKLINYTTRKPLGVVASISPWNLPILSLTWKAAPALICGNALICKPSEETPSSATLIAEAFHEAGVPPGVFNLVHGFGPGSAGEALTTHPGIDFTGESRTGSTIMKAVADGMKEVSFELGGKNAAIVFADADFDAAVDGVIRSSFTNTGQVCLCSERVYVERPIFERFVAALKAKTEALKIGWPDDPDVFMGSLISREHRDKVLSYYRLAVEEGRGQRRRRAELRRRARRRRLRAADDLDRPGRHGALRHRGSVRSGVPHRALRPRGRSHPPHQSQRLRSGVGGVDQQPVARAPRLPAAGRGHRLGQHLVLARPAHAVRRHQAVGHRA